MRKYSIREAFYTLQGEGVHAGTPAVFVRFAGCNIWSGREKDREEAKSRGVCAAWCDTHFVGVDGDNGGKLTAEEIADLCTRLHVGDNKGSNRLVVVFTGGEPGLQLNAALVEVMQSRGFSVHVETNGTLELPEVDWVTLSPKPPSKPREQHYDEVKVVYPAGVDPSQYKHLASNRFIQPVDWSGPWDSDEPWMPQDDQHTEAAVQYVLDHPSWRLSLQTHKITGVP